MALTESEAPDEALEMRTGIIGLITWSSALTVSDDVVAASHKVAAWLEGCWLLSVAGAGWRCCTAAVGSKGREVADNVEA